MFVYIFMMSQFELSKSQWGGEELGVTPSIPDSNTRLVILVGKPPFLGGWLTEILTAPIGVKIDIVKVAKRILF